VATQQDVRTSDLGPVSTSDLSGIVDPAGASTEAPDGYVPPDADVTENLPPQCSF
jgi:hypothetical protein